jgi:multidrug efflux pump subunit AcrB
MMTGLSFVLGVLPLVVATGAGAASRHSVGTPVFGGMLAAAFAGTLAAPVLYAGVERVKRGRGGRDSSSSSTQAAEAASARE